MRYIILATLLGACGSEPLKAPPPRDGTYQVVGHKTKLTDRCGDPRDFQQVVVVRDDGATLASLEGDVMAQGGLYGDDYVLTTERAYDNGDQSVWIYTLQFQPDGNFIGLLEFFQTVSGELCEMRAELTGTRR